MYRQFHIASLLLAFGAFFLPFLLEPSSRAHGDVRIPKSAQARESSKQEEIPALEKKRRREHASFCEALRGDIALGVF